MPLLTSEFESIDRTERFLLPTCDALRVDNITVGVMVREFVLSLIAVAVPDRGVDEKLTLTGDLGSNGKKEPA